MPASNNTTAPSRKRGAIVDLRSAIAIAEAQAIYASAEALLNERKANGEYNARAAATIAACRAAVGAPQGPGWDFPGGQAFVLPERRYDETISASAALETAKANLARITAANATGRDKAHATLAKLLDKANGKGQTRRIRSAWLLERFVEFAIKNPERGFSQDGGSVSVKAYRYPYATTEFNARRIRPGRYSCSATRSRYWPHSGRPA